MLYCECFFMACLMRVFFLKIYLRCFLFMKMSFFLFFSLI